jgi:peptidoglycan L-alanyl-D-glutamate endopeptidase CwlK
MPIHQTMTGVPANEVDAIVRNLRLQGATVQKHPAPDGTWTITAIRGEPAADSTALSPAAASAAGTPAAAPPLEAPRTSAIDVDARDTDTAKLHPAVRDRVKKVLDALTAQSVPMKLFEAYRGPERQQHLFAKGRNATGQIVDRSKVVTQAPAWHSYHQYGLAVDIVIAAPGVDPWETGTDQALSWWKTYHAVARDHGMEPLSFETPHVQLAGLSTSGLLAGRYPDGGDDSWADNLGAVIARWAGADRPPAPPSTERPPLTAVLPGAGAVLREPGVDWSMLPRVAASDFSNPFGGQPWRVDGRGIYLRNGTDAIPLRSPGTPRTCSAVVAAFGPAIARAAAKHGVPPELLIMTIATETGIFRDDGFTGPKTFRWEAHIKDYSAGPMQILSETARRISTAAGLGYSPDSFPSLDREPSRTPKDLALYDGEVALDIGAAFIRQIIEKVGTNPLLVAASYNAGSLRPSSTNLWRIHCSGDHLDRAAIWYGDACDCMSLLGR